MVPGCGMRPLLATGHLTYLNVSAEQCRRAADILVELAEGVLPTSS